MLPGTGSRGSVSTCPSDMFGRVALNRLSTITDHKPWLPGDCLEVPHGRRRHRSDHYEQSDKGVMSAVELTRCLPLLLRFVVYFATHY